MPKDCMLTAVALALGICAATAAATDPGIGSSTGSQLETLVVTGNRLGLARPISSSGTAIYVLDDFALESRQTRFISDVLRDAPGVAVNRTGTVGGLTQVRMRGAEGNHTLVLLNGMDLSDPFQGEFNFAGLMAGGIERIEVLRGEQSSLYGSDAIGGVINLIPMRGTEDTPIEAFAEAGDFGTRQVAASAGFGSDRVDVFTTLSRFETDGINISRFGSEKDGARNLSGLINAGYRPLPALELRGLFRWVDTRSESDPQDFSFPADPTQGLVIDGDRVRKTDERYGSVSARVILADGRSNTELQYAFADVDARNYGDSAPSFFSEGDRERVSLVSGYVLASAAFTHTFTGAVDWKQERYRNVPIGTPGPEHARRKLDTVGYVAAYEMTRGGLGLGASYRYDDNDRFRDAHTYRVQGSYRFESSATRLRAAFGTGVKNPTNFELFGFNPDTFISNPDLKPERSRSWEVGLDQPLFEQRANLGLTWFDARLEDEIFTVFLPGFVSSPDNRSSNSDRRGLELTVDAALGQRWTVNGVYTWLDATENGEEEVRRPPHIGSINLTRSLFDARGSITASIRYNGKQQDPEFIFATPATRVTLDAYTLVNLNGSFDVTDRVTLFARVENLLDEDYEEVFSYRAPGRGVYGGIRVRW